MSQSEVDKKINEWIETVNKHKGEETVPWPAPYPVDGRNYYGQQAIELVTEDIIRHYIAALGDRNPLFWSHDYARRTRWGSIIAPPTFTDSICISWTTQREPPPLTWNFPTNPAGNRRELFGVFRPGDRIRIVSKWLGYDERKSREPRPYRLFIESDQRSFINQKDEVVAVVTYRYAKLITNTDPSGSHLFTGDVEKERHRFTEEELEPVWRGYDENKRRGAEVLYWEDVAVGDEIPTIGVGPFTSSDSVAFHAAQQGHCVAFDMNWERRKTGAFGRPRLPDPETPLAASLMFVHVADRPGALAYGLGYQFEGLLGRLLTDWIGDDGFLKVLDCRFRALPFVGDVFYMKGTVTGKRSENGEHLADLDVRIDNHDGELIVSGSATVRLPSRTA